MSNPPGLDGILIPHSGSKLLGVLYRAGGAGLHPTALLLHGLPGLEKNSDIAYALRDAGWNVLILHYRGCWGSEGDYTLAGIPEDVRAAVDTITCRDFPVDSNRIAAVGHGWGGWAAIIAASRDPRIRAVVTLGGLSNLRTMSSASIASNWSLPSSRGSQANCDSLLTCTVTRSKMLSYRQNNLLPNEAPHESHDPVRGCPPIRARWRLCLCRRLYAPHPVCRRA